MNQNCYHIILFFFVCTASTYAQLDSIQQLPEVILTDSRLINFSKGFKLEKLNDTIVEKNSGSLTEALRYNSSIYFKENGYGMVSSPSLRGTNAAQTAVIWNGININSVFTGQTDFNTISPLGYDEITIRSGGGGVQYGSGAVGGSVHLNNNFSFEKIDTTEVGLHYGSFSTVAGKFNITETWGDHYLNVGTDFVSSENDYDYVGKDMKNEHGQFLRFVARINEARKLAHGVATWNSEYIYNNRNFCGSSNTVGVDGYKDVTTRNVWNLKQNVGLFKITASAAHLFEQYRYYPDTEKPFFDQGRANTLIGSLQSEVLLKKKFRINGKFEYSYIDGKGDNVDNHSRETLAAVILFNHILSTSFNYGINLRKEFLNGFENPWLFSADAMWKVSENYSLRFNGSKNYRVPTFNDLYWYAGGNVDLQPESSYQGEIGQEINFNNLKIDLAAYYISSKDLIKWVPGNAGIWQPLNIDKTRNYGVEASINYSVAFKNRRTLSFSANYSYTKAEDLAKNKQLIYVPFHKATGTIQYNFKRLMAYVQGIYNAQAFTTTDNNYSVGAYSVFNLGVDYTLASNPNITFGGRLKNVFNSYYENVAYRPMPSRNFEIFINFNI